LERKVKKLRELKGRLLTKLQPAKKKREMLPLTEKSFFV